MVWVRTFPAVSEGFFNDIWLLGSYLNRVRTDFSEKNQDFFKTFSRPKVKNSRPKKSKNTTCFLPQTHKLWCFCANHPENMRWVRHACLLVTALKRFPRLIEWPDVRFTQRTLSKFQDEVRRKIAHQHRRKFECTAPSVITATSWVWS